MQDYLKKFREKTENADIGYFMPDGICPFLFYNLTPYIFTLANNGWFDWVKKHRSNSYRKKINKDDFKRKEVNRLYPNEVLVRCPNPCVNVVAGIGLSSNDKIKIRILHSQDSCLNNHKAGEEIVMDQIDARVNALDFNSYFPEALKLSLRCGLPQENRSPCDIDNNVMLEVSKIIFPCRYHKTKNKFKSHFLPQDFCIHIFHSIYPHVLGLMYNGDIEKELKISCPVKKCDLTLALKKTCRIENKLIKTAIGLLNKLFEIFFYPLDIVDYYFRINVLDIKNKPPECQLIKDKEYPVNLKDNNFLCPASFHILYPYLLISALGNRMIWDQNDNMNLLSCPDCVGAIYKIG